MNESDYIAIIGGVIFIVIILFITISYLKLSHHTNEIPMTSLLYRLEKAESRIAELEAKLEAAATTQRVCDVIEWLGTQCTNSQAVKALIKALEAKS